MEDKEIIEIAKKVKQFCKKNVCYKCIFNDNDEECILQQQPPLHWELEKIKKGK